MIWNSYGIAFDGRDWLSFGNGIARNVIIFCFDNSSSSHVDDVNINFLVLGLSATFRINGSFGLAE